MKCSKETMLLYAVTDRAWTSRQSLADQVKSALMGGITCLQLREKDLDFQPFLEEAQRLKALCQHYQVPFIINDNVDVAIACDADGIHVGQHDLDTISVRNRIGGDKILGVSVQTVDQALKAEQDGADYLGVGAVFTTATKIDADAVTLETLTDICRAVTVPVVAIGGITGENICKLTGTGVDGVALVSAIFASQNIETQCRQLLKRSEDMVQS